MQERLFLIFFLMQKLNLDDGGKVLLKKAVFLGSPFLHGV